MNGRILPGNTLVFQYEELLETEEHTLEDIVDNIFNKLKVFLLNTYILDWEACLNRLIGLNKKVEEFKDEHFLLWEKFYHVHGSHRHRDDDY